jgi:hypothetical protein
MCDTLPIAGICVVCGVTAYDFITAREILYGRTGPRRELGFAKRAFGRQSEPYSPLTQYPLSGDLQFYTRMYPYPIFC